MATGTELRSAFDAPAVRALADRIAPNLPGFKAKQFVTEVAADLPPLALMQRARRIARGLRDHLPTDYPAAVGVLLASLGDDTGPAAGGNAGFRFMPVLDFVGTFGLDHPGVSLDALGTMTRYFTGEFAVRPYLLRHPDLTLARMHAWAADPDWRVRRLASEGSRPRLPWGVRLGPFVDDPTPVLAVLERLRADPHPIVRRSVANNLKDIARDHPAVALATGRRWWNANTEETRWVVRRGLRSLVKAGDQGALTLLGFHGGGRTSVTSFRLSRPQIALGESLAFSFVLRSDEPGPVHLSIDYRIHHRRKSGSQSAKVFKLTRRRLAPGESLAVSRRHAIVPITTRRYYAGTHKLELLVNGLSVGVLSFELST